MSFISLSVIMFKVNKLLIYNKVKGFDNYNKKLIQSAQTRREQYYRDLLIRHNIGGIERHTGRRFCVSLGLGGSRSIPNLEPHTKKYIRRGSIIMSDCWPANNNISNLVDANRVSTNSAITPLTIAIASVSSILQTVGFIPKR